MIESARLPPLPDNAGCSSTPKNGFFNDCQFGVFSRAMISRIRAFWLSESIGESMR